MFIPDLHFSISDPGPIRPRVLNCNKEFKYQYFDPENWKYDPGCLSRIRIIVHPGPGSRGQNAPDPESGSATLQPSSGTGTYLPTPV
jgi:hypothetical protein